MNSFLKNKNFHRFATGGLLSAAGDVFFYLAFMTYASQLRNYSLAISLIAISEAVPKFLEIFAGYLADKTRHKFRNIVLTALFRCLFYALAALLLASKADQWKLLLAIITINFLSDLCGSYSSGLIVPIVVNLVGEDDFGEADGFVSGCKQIIDILAQFAGAGLILVLSYAALAWINSLTFLLAAILFALVGRKATPVQTETAETPAFWPAMRQAYQQAKKQTGLLTVVLVLAVINASLTAIEPLFSITLAAHKSSMVISSYSFTLALTNVAAAIGAASGSIFGQKIFRSVNIFLLASWTALCSLLTTLSLFCQNSWLTALLFGLLAALASTVSIKMTQWLVTSVDRQILASTVGLLNTILMAASPLITTLITSISSLSLAWAIISLLALEVAALAVLLVLSQRQLFKISA